MTPIATGTYGTGPSATDRPRRRFWVLPIVFVSVLVAFGVAVLALRVLGITEGPLRGGPPPFWFLFPLGFVLVAVVLVTWVRPWAWGASPGCGWEWAGHGPEELVRERYARGEISAEQMRVILRELSETPLPRPSDPPDP